MPVELEPLRQAVQYNCHIADARHAGDYTLCTYLLKMRELYRWEQGIDFGEPLDNEAVGEWVKAREQLWQSLENQAFAPVPVNAKRLDPFDDEAVNAALAEQGLAYSGGFGRHAAPHFFLADLAERREHGEFTILITGREYARDLTAPPAMTRGSYIFVRCESLRRLLWERVQEWRWNRCDSPLGRAFQHYDLDRDLAAGLDRLEADQLDVVLLHELGEVDAGRGLEERWQALLAEVVDTRAELELRAVRDNLADTCSTLPALLEQARPELLHFYFGTFSPMRRLLFPRLLGGYRHWQDTGDLGPLRAAVEAGSDHWRGVMETAIALHEQQGDGCGQTVRALIERSHL